MKDYPVPMKTQQLKTHMIKGEAQKRAIASPLRLEIMGQFATGHPLSVKEIAERMGRPPSAIHYHVRLLVRSGLLIKSGERREGRRIEALYRPVADVFAVPGTNTDSPEADNEVALKTMTTAFRMAERDMKAALAGSHARSEGKHRNFFGTRLHCRLSRQELAALNRHLDAIQKTLAAAHHHDTPRDDDEFLSLTLALMPLPDRAAKP